MEYELVLDPHLGLDEGRPAGVNALRDANDMERVTILEDRRELSGGEREDRLVDNLRDEAPFRGPVELPAARGGRPLRSLLGDVGERTPFEDVVSHLGELVPGLLPSPLPAYFYRQLLEASLGREVVVGEAGLVQGDHLGMRDLGVGVDLLLHPLLGQGPLEKHLSDAVDRLAARPQLGLVFGRGIEAGCLDHLRELLGVEGLVDFLFDLGEPLFGDRSAGIDEHDQRIDMLRQDLLADLDFQLAHLLRLHARGDLRQPLQRRRRKEIPLEHHLGPDTGDDLRIAERFRAGHRRAILHRLVERRLDHAPGFLGLFGPGKFLAEQRDGGAGTIADARENVVVAGRAPRLPTRPRLRP